MWAFKFVEDSLDSASLVYYDHPTLVYYEHVRNLRSTSWSDLQASLLLISTTPLFQWLISSHIERSFSSLNLFTKKLSILYRIRG